MDLNIENNKNNIDTSFSKELKNLIEKKVTFSIDRFEENFAICENKTTNEMINIDRTLLPENCKEGDIIKFENGVYVIDKTNTQVEKEEIRNMVNNLFKRKNEQN